MLTGGLTAGPRRARGSGQAQTSGGCERTRGQLRVTSSQLALATGLDFLTLGPDLGTLRRNSEVQYITHRYGLNLVRMENPPSDSARLLPGSPGQGPRAMAVLRAGRVTDVHPTFLGENFLAVSFSLSSQFRARGWEQSSSEEQEQALEAGPAWQTGTPCEASVLGPLSQACPWLCPHELTDRGAPAPPRVSAGGRLCSLCSELRGQGCARSGQGQAPALVTL